MNKIRKRTINQYELLNSLSGDEMVLIDLGGVYYKTSLNNIKNYSTSNLPTGVTNNDVLVFKNGNITENDINKFVVCYTDFNQLNQFINDGGNFNEFNGPLNEIRLPELEGFSGQEGLYNLNIDYNTFQHANIDNQIIFFSIDVYDENEGWSSESFDLYKRHFLFKLTDPFFNDLINNENFEYELFDENRYIPSNEYSVLLLLKHYFDNGFPINSYNGSENLTNTVGNLFLSNSSNLLIDSKIEVIIYTNVNYISISSNSFSINNQDYYVIVVDRIKRLLPVLPLKLRRKIFGVVDSINNDNNTVNIKPLPNSYEGILFNSYGSENFIINNKVFTYDENQYDRWEEGFVPFIGGLMYNVKYICNEYGYYSEDALLLTTSQRYIAITTDLVTNPIIFIKDDYGDE